MGEYYNPKRSRNLYDPQSGTPFRLSRSKIDAFLKCPRCFYLDRRLGVGQPPGFPFNLNSAVDTLLKKEFDYYRELKEPHPLMVKNQIRAIPFQHEKMEEWRDALRRGVAYHHEKTNLMITGGVDDIWVNDAGELIIVDYKATSKNEEVNLDAPWQDGYKRQMEMYQWLFRKNNFRVSPLGYFVYCNADAGKEAFNERLEFSIKVIPYEGSDHWVEPTLEKIFNCLQSEVLPSSSANCEFCQYHQAVSQVEAKSQ